MPFSNQDEKGDRAEHRQICVAAWIDNTGPSGSPSIPNGCAHMETMNLTALNYSDTVVPISQLGVSAT
jgi:hypothetical protein